jgi:hypothetical protein
VSRNGAITGAVGRTSTASPPISAGILARLFSRSLEFPECEPVSSDGGNLFYERGCSQLDVR